MEFVKFHMPDGKPIYIREKYIDSFWESENGNAKLGILGQSSPFETTDSMTYAFRMLEAEVRHV